GVPGLGPHPLAPELDIATGLVRVHGGDGVRGVVEQGDQLPEVGRVPGCGSPAVVDHHLRLGGHDDLVGAQSDDGGDRGRQTVHDDRGGLLWPREGREVRQAVEDVAAGGVPVQVDRAFDLVDLRQEVADRRTEAADLVVDEDV